MITVEAYNDLLKNEGLELWNFGPSTTVMPVSDLNDGSYFTATVIFVRKRLSNGASKVLGIEMPHIKKNDACIDDSLIQEIRDTFESKCSIVDEDHPLPARPLWLNRGIIGG
jgi:hypothetical protein